MHKSPFHERVLEASQNYMPNTQVSEETSAYARLAFLRGVEFAERELFKELEVLKANIQNIVNTLALTQNSITAIQDFLTQETGQQIVSRK